MQVNTKSAIHLIVSKDPSRPVLNCLNVVAEHPIIGGAALEATDGRRYVAIPVQLEGQDVPGLVPSHIVADIARISRDNGNLRDSVIIRKRWLRFMDDSLVPRRLDEEIGVWPDVRSIMPRINGDSPSRISSHCFNGEYLGDICAAFGRPCDEVLLTFYGDEQVFEIVPAAYPGGEKGYGVLMPVRRIDPDGFYI